MVRLLIALACVGSVSCGQIDKKKDDKDSKVESATSSDVMFSGYVQKAFTIKVNGTQFSDSEAFYTQFIDKLVKPAYPNIQGKDVTIEGKYGLSEFGSSSNVYMSSVDTNGHLFQGRTDDQSKFTIKVQASALDETFKAKVVVSIGLQIAQTGADALHYCYLLYGSKDGVSVGDNSKPIIFDDFTTELTTYNCDAVKDSTLSIPGLSSKTDTPIKVTAAAMMLSGQMYVAEAATQVDGKWCFPIVTLAAGQQTASSTSCVGSTSTDLSKLAQIESLAVKDGVLTAKRGNTIATFKPDGSSYQETSVDGHENSRVVLVDTTLKLIDGKQVCGIDLTGCVDAPAAACDLGYPKSIVQLGSGFAVANGVNDQSTSYCGTGVHTLGADLAYVKRSKVTADILASDTKTLYSVSVQDNALKVTKLTLE